MKWKQAGQQVAERAQRSESRMSIGPSFGSIVFQSSLTWYPAPGKGSTAR